MHTSCGCSALVPVVHTKQPCEHACEARGVRSHAPYTLSTLSLPDVPLLRTTFALRPSRGGGLRYALHRLSTWSSWSSSPASPARDYSMRSRAEAQSQQRAIALRTLRRPSKTGSCTTRAKFGPTVRTTARSRISTHSKETAAGARAHIILGVDVGVGFKQNLHAFNTGS